MSALTRIARFAVAVALAVAGVAMVSHHAGSDAHVVAVHEHPVVAVAETHAAHAHDIRHAPDEHSEYGHDHGHGDGLVIMGCAALIVALLASLRFAPPAHAAQSAPPLAFAPAAVTPHSGAKPEPPALEQLCVSRR